MVHTHNLKNTLNPDGSRTVNAPTTSPADGNAARINGIVEYAIDSWTGTESGGNALHRVTPAGTKTDNVGTTQNLNLGQDALNQFVNGN